MGASHSETATGKGVSFKPPGNSILFCYPEIIIMTGGFGVTCANATPWEKWKYRLSSIHVNAHWELLFSWAPPWELA
jgi:hypothetical protein